MRWVRQGIRTELRPMLSLAGPVILAELGWMAMGIVDTLYLCLALSPPVMLLLSGGIPWLGRLGVHPAVTAQAVPFLRALTWGTFPLFLYAAFRRYLQGMGLVKPVMFALVSANVINAVGDWILIYGHLGVPALGVAGSG